ncbi:MAG: phosphopyruvate hydratase [Candidatus Aenigmarchaeota archaeon]|nr:phosphopyruvate hydratase [Candidatus Aenigmarchaeota archaeon]
MQIKSIKADWIADSELNKTVGVWIETDDGTFFGSAPQGTSDGDYEAVAAPVDEAVKNIREIVPKLMLFDPSDLKTLDEYLVQLGGHQMQSFGGNASVALSSAWAKMAAHSKGVSVPEYLAEELGTRMRMPVPCFNIINGGLHGALDPSGKPYNPIQELMLVPASAESFEEGYCMVMQVFKNLRNATGEALVGKEGGFSPAQHLDWSIGKVKEAIEMSGYETKDFRLALDCAASEFFKDGLYTPVAGDKQRNVEEMVEFYKGLISNSPIKVMSIEDPLDQNDFRGFAEVTKALDGMMIVGDDLYVTQLERVKKGVEQKSTNAVLVKINQNGTVTGTLDTIRFGLENRLLHMISHRSKRAPGDFIDAYLSVAVGQFIKHGSSRGERVEIYNELLRIEREAKEMNRPLPYAGRSLVK